MQRGLKLLSLRLSGLLNVSCYVLKAECALLDWVIPVLTSSGLFCFFNSCVCFVEFSFLLPLVRLCCFQAICLQQPFLSSYCLWSPGGLETSSLGWVGSLDCGY